MPELSWLQPATVQAFHAQPVRPPRRIQNEYTIDDLKTWIRIRCADELRHIPTIDKFKFHRFLIPTPIEKNYSSTELLCLGASPSSETIFWADTDGVNIYYFQQKFNNLTAPLELIDYRHVHWQGPQEVFGMLSDSDNPPGYFVATKARREVFVQYIFLASGRLNHMQNVKKQNVPLLFEMACRHIHFEAEKAIQCSGQYEMEQTNNYPTNSTPLPLDDDTQADASPVIDYHGSTQESWVAPEPPASHSSDVDARFKNQNVPVRPEIEDTQQEEDEKGPEEEAGQLIGACFSPQATTTTDEVEAPLTPCSVTVLTEPDTNTISKQSTRKRLRTGNEEDIEQPRCDSTHTSHVAVADSTLSGGCTERARIDNVSTPSHNSKLTLHFLHESRSMTNSNNRPPQRLCRNSHGALTALTLFFICTNAHV